MAAATYDLSQGGSLELSGAGSGRCFVIERQVDFSVNAIANGESATLVNVPANTFVLGVQAYVDTAEGTDAIDIGDAASATYYLAIGSLATAAVTLWSDGTTGAGRVLAVAATKFYTAKNDIRLTAHTGNLASGKVTVRVCMVKFGA